MPTMPNSNPLRSYQRAVDELAASLAAIPSDGWETSSPCAEWTVRDLAGHVIWAQEQLRCWATGEEYAGPPGGPGTAHPAAVCGPDPLGHWKAARSACDDTLTAASLDQPIVVPGLGETPLVTMITILTHDSLIHAWDLRHAVGVAERLPSDLVAESEAWARANVMRVPGFFGPEVVPPAGADEQTRWLAFLGRTASPATPR